MKKLIISPALLALSCLALPAAAEGEAEPDLLDVSFDSLQQVTLASKREERPAEAAASITLYNQDDIRRTGYETISQLADITPGYSGYQIYGEKVLATRGQKAGSFNNHKHLLLFDGIPINFQRNYKAGIGDELPLFGMERVEFMRGPGSALYGTSAFFGVIGVDPRPSARTTRGSLSAGTASRDGAWRLNGDGQFIQGSSYTQAKLGVSDKNNSMNYAGVTDTPAYRYRDKESNQFAWLSHGLSDGPLQGLSLNLLYQNKVGGLGENWAGEPYTDPYNNLQWKQFIPYLKYDRQISENWQIGGYVKYASTKEAGSVRYKDKSYSDYDIRQKGMAALIETRWTQGDSHVTAGIEYDVRRENMSGSYEFDYSATGTKTSVTKTETDPYKTESVFLQWQERWAVLSGLTSTVGARSDCLTVSGVNTCKVSPRFTLVQRITPEWTTKYLYGEALRAPGFKEIELNKTARQNGAAAPSSLLPETFRSSEVSLERGTGRGYFGVNLFSNETVNALDGTSSGNQNYFQNTTGKVEARGLEVYGRHAFGGGWMLQGQISLVDTRTPNGGEVRDVPTRTGSLILSHPIPLGEYRSEMAWIARGMGGFASAANGSTAPDIGFLDAQWRLPLGRNLSVIAQGLNLFDKEAKYSKNGIIDVPMQQRTFWLSLRGSW
jgi:outer membrane cobalamin receptor